MSNIDRDKLIKKAVLFLQSVKNNKNEICIDENRKLAKELSNLEHFYYSREILTHLKKEYGYCFDEKDNQDMAKYIYYDKSLSSDFRFREALGYLKQYKNINIITDVKTNINTSRIIGSILKNWYYHNNDISLLKKSKNFFYKGYQLWLGLNDKEKIESDNGYCALNYASIIEINLFRKYTEFISLNDANKENKSFSRNFIDIDKIQNKRFISYYQDQIIEAKQVRESILSCLLDKDWNNIKNKNTYEIGEKGEKKKMYIYSTIIYTLLGLFDYKKSTIFQNKYKQDTNNLKLIEKNKAVLKHFLQIYNLQTKIYENNSSGDVFAKKEFVKNLLIFFPTFNLEEMPTLQEKVGLALSGGGFRASYFHIGVMAALAEKDKLKDIEVISCVSGGSILGSMFYLKIRKLLENTTDNEITNNHYREIIVQLIDEFHKGVKTNLRVKWFTNLYSNLKMGLSKNYSRTHRMAELYDDNFYKNIILGRKVPFNELKIIPIELPNFNIKTGNFFRKNKVPQLVINTTSLNTGHNFQFGATWMGESPILINEETDSKPILRRMYYSDAPDGYKKFPLCYAVGASACVPALFGALPLDNLYQNVDLKLVDGGVNDNQGLDALIENECKKIIISDASGQLEFLEKIKSSTFNELSRSTEVSLEKNRNQQLNALLNEKANYFEDILLLHLRKGLNSKSINWINNNQPENKTFANFNDAINTSYNVNKKIQESLASIRTDLDSFSDTEAYSLMFSGYLQTKESLNIQEACNEHELLDESIRVKWKFENKIEHAFKNFPDKLATELKLGNKKFFRKWSLLKLKNPLLYYVFLLVPIGIVFSMFLWFMYNYIVVQGNDISLRSSYAWFYNFLNTPFSIKLIKYTKWIGVLFIIETITNLITKNRFKHIGVLKTPVYLVAGILAFVFSNLYLFALNNLFLKTGTIKKFLK